MARFGANISDAHSCFIFIPTQILNQEQETKSLAPTLELVGYHTLSTDIIPDCLIPRGSGLIGWVAKHKQAIHVSPFERDSRTLGIYSKDQSLKSFIGIPVPLQQGSQVQTGVIACDSKKSYAFSKLQGKLLEDLAKEIANTISLLKKSRKKSVYESSWHTFIQRGVQLREAIGSSSLEVLRLRLVNAQEMEDKTGTKASIDAIEQCMRLIEQALPPHFPALKHPSGDIIVILDNMMSSFYENKINAICNHIGNGKQQVSFAFSRSSFREKKNRTATLETLVLQTCKMETAADSTASQFGELYEHRRA